MAGEVPPLNVEVLVSLGNLTSAVNQATEGLNKIGTAAKEQESKFLSLKTVMLGTFAGAGLQQGIQMFTSFLKESVNAAEQAQLATTQLATAMNDAKINTEANRKVVEASIGSMEKLAFTHVEATKAMTTLILATGSATEAQKEMGTIANYARANQMSLSEATTLLTKVSGGATRAFKAYHIELDTSLSKHDALIKALDELSVKLKDQAAAYLKTYAGQMADLNDKMENVKETVGAVLLPILRKLADMFVEVSSFVSKHTDLMIVLIAVIGTALVAALVAATTAAWAMIAPFVAAIAPFAAVAAGVALLWNHFQVFRDVVVDAVKVVITYLGYFIGFIGTLLEAASHLPVIGSHFKGIAAEVNKAAVEVGNFNGKLDALKNKKINLKFSALAPDLAGGASGGAGGSGYDDGGVGGSTATAAAKTSQDKIKAQMDALQKVAKDALDKTTIAESDNAQQVFLIRRDNAQKVEQIERDHTQQLDKLNRDYQQKQNEILDTYNTNKLNAETAAADKLVTLQKDTAQKITDAQQAAADQQIAITQKSIDLMTNAFSNVTGYDIGSNFADGIKGGFTIGAGDLVKQMQDHLASIQQLQNDAGKLAGLGYTQTFIDQVVAQGPKIGDQLAQALMAADPATTGSLQDLYANIQNTSAHGLDQLATDMNQGGQLATEQLTASYAKVGTDLQVQLDKITSDSKDAEAQIQTDLQTTLTQLAKDRDKSMADALQSYQNQMADMNTSYQNQLADAAQSLTNSLADAATALNNKLADIMKSTLDSLKTINTALAGLGVGGAAGGGSYISTPLLPSTTANVGANIGIINSNIAGLSKAVGAPITVNQTNNINGSTSSSDITTATLNGITLGQTQGLMTAKPTMSTFQR
jgi:hypothetical protein